MSALWLTRASPKNSKPTSRPMSFIIGIVNNTSFTHVRWVKLQSRCKYLSQLLPTDLPDVSPSHLDSNNPCHLVFYCMQADMSCTFSFRHECGSYLSSYMVYQQSALKLCILNNSCAISFRALTRILNQ